MHTKQVDTKQLFYSVAIIFVFAIVGCNNKKTAIEIVNKSVETHGNISEWKNIHSLSFLKKTVLYKKDGSVEKEMIQKQQLFKDGSGGEIFSIADSVFYRKNKNRVFKNDSLVVDMQEISRINKMFASAYYVVAQPFHLLESKAKFERINDTLINQNDAYAVRVFYNEDDKKSDQWTYYFSKKDSKVLGCKVYHHPTTSFIENTSFDTKTQFVFNAARTSTFIKNRKKDYLRATYEYSNYLVE